MRAGRELRGAVMDVAGRVGEVNRRRVAERVGTRGDDGDTGDADVGPVSTEREFG